MWELATIALVLVLGTGGLVVARGGMLDRIVGLQLVGLQGALLMVVIAVATGRRALLDVALVMAVLTLASGLAYARFAERWL